MIKMHLAHSLKQRAGQGQVTQRLFRHWDQVPVKWDYMPAIPHNMEAEMSMNMSPGHILLWGDQLRGR
jgi:hypothetical protein